jgi:hypothetical protein
VSARLGPSKVSGYTVEDEARWHTAIHVALLQCGWPSARFYVHVVRVDAGCMKATVSWTRVVNGLRVHEAFGTSFAPEKDEHDAMLWACEDLQKVAAEKGMPAGWVQP